MLAHRLRRSGCNHCAGERRSGCGTIRETCRGERSSRRPVASDGTGAGAGRHRQQHGECRHERLQGALVALQRIRHARGERRGFPAPGPRRSPMSSTRARRSISARDAVRAHGQPARCRPAGRQLPRRPDAGRRALHQGRVAAGQSARPARHPDRHAGAGRGRADPSGPARSDAKIAADGTVSSDQGIRGKLRQVKFANPQALVNDGANLFSSPTPPRARRPAGAAGNRRDRVAPTSRRWSRLTRLMEVQRSYQTLANIMSKSDELRSRAISRLADQQA